MRGGVVPWIAAWTLLVSCAESTQRSAVPAESSPPAAAEPVASPAPPEAPVPPVSAPTSPPAPSTTTRTATDPVVPPDAVTQFLVADHEGVWLATADGERRQLVDGAIRWAIPDRVGGLLFQRVETGTWRPVADTPDTARWTWAGSGTAQPIWRMLPGEAPTVLVDAPVDGRLELIDSALLDGAPTVAYLRTRYFTVTAAGDRGPWWDSAVAELVVHDLESDTELVVRTQDVGWEYSPRAPSLGSRLALDVITDYAGESQHIEFWPLDAAVETVELTACPEPSVWPNCDLVADLAPNGHALALARSRPGRTGELEVVSHDVISGRRQQRVTITAEEGSRPRFVDTTGDHTLMLAGTPARATDPPRLARGAEGPWVQLLQAELSDHNRSDPDGPYLVADGIFGPRTEAAVRALQTERDLPVTGAVDTATWKQLGPITVYAEPILVDPAGRTAGVHPIPTGTPVLHAARHGPTITLWSGPDWPTPRRPEPLPILRPDGLGAYDFGTEMSVVMSWATEVLGTPAITGTPETTPGGPPISALPPNLMYICGEQVAAHWETAALDLYFAQWEFDDDGLVSCDGPVRLVAWGVGSHRVPGAPGEVHSPRLSTEDGVGVGTTVAELIALDADPTFMQWDDSGVFPAGFHLGEPARFEHLFGVLAWEWIRDLQTALNDDGHRLAVDGVPGPRTRAALDSYRIEHGLASLDEAILDLALEPGSDVEIASIASGRWPLEFECGTLELVGWHTPC